MSKFMPKMFYKIGSRSKSKIVNNQFNPGACAIKLFTAVIISAP